MAPRFILPVALALLVVSGCRKSDAPTPVADPTATHAEVPAPLKNATGDPAVTEADLSGVLAGLTQAVRKYGFEKQRMPKNLEELVAAGYLSALPTAPAGKKFTIDEKKVQVVLTGR